MLTIYSLPIAFIITLLVVPIFKKIAIKYNFIDEPNYRKMQNYQKPLLGGVAIYVSISLTFLLLQNIDISGQTLLVWIIAGLLMILGVIDDKYDIKAYYKLLGQVILSFACAYILGGINAIEIYGHSLYFSDFLGIIIQMIWLVALINAFNLIDGLDGLAAGTAIMSLSTILIVGIISNNINLIAFLLIVIGALFGFLFYNFYPSSIFLGDAGSMVIGYIIAIISINNFKTVTITSSVLIFLIAFLPVLDTTLSFIRRKINGEKTFKADSLHFHHRLLMHGYTHAQAVLLMYLFMALYAISGVIISFASVAVKMGIIVFLILLTTFIIEKFYLLSNQYTYVTNFIKKIKK